MSSLKFAPPPRLFFFFIYFLLIEIFWGKSDPLLSKNDTILRACCKMLLSQPPMHLKFNPIYIVFFELLGDNGIRQYYIPANNVLVLLFIDPDMTDYL